MKKLKLIYAILLNVILSVGPWLFIHIHFGWVISFLAFYFLLVPFANYIVLRATGINVAKTIFR